MLIYHNSASCIEHTSGAYPKSLQHPKWKDSLHKLYAQGWNFHEMFYIIGDLQKKTWFSIHFPIEIQYPILRHTQFCPWENPPSWRSTGVTGVSDAPPLDVAKVLEMAIVAL